MDNALILHKIVSLKRCIERIKATTPVNKELLFTDWNIQDIIILNLERAVQVSVDIAAHICSELDGDIPMTMASSFEYLHDFGIITEKISMRMQKSVGFRNIAVHEYESINWNVVYSVITNHLNDFKDYAREITEWMDRQETK
ncbi:DUF86 domain-containing protein [Candidatus Magnetomoraceae bacterium gMMP-1]